jgi:hypothetical protein
MPKNSKKKVVSENYMDKIPVRSASRPWRVTDDGMVEIDMENKGFYHRIAQKYFKKPKVSHIALDAYGSTLWENIDGTNTVYDILTIMETTFPEEKDKMINRVVAFMTTLETNRFVDMK